MNSILPAIVSLFVINILPIEGYVSVCYYTNWSKYRPGKGKFVPSDVDPNLCTHLIYAFAELTWGTYELNPLEYNEETWYQEIQSLKSQNPSLKTLVAVGGWNMGSIVFSNMVTDENFRRKFVTTSIKFVRDNGFDGLDIDWEYPAMRGGRASDKANYVLLLNETMEAFKKEAEDTGRERLLLMAAVPAGKENIDNGYDVLQVQRYLDFINLMSYDLHGAWESETGHNSPLYSRTGESVPESQLNMAWAANYWITNGAPKTKLVIGLAAYGRGFRLSDPALTEPGSPAPQASPAGTYTREAGIYSYYEICEMSGTRYWMNDSQVPYFVTSDNVWIGYDDEESFKIKLNWIKDEMFGGAMVWNYDLDDFRMTCPSSTKRYPLISLIRDILGPFDNSATIVATSTTNTASTISPSSSVSITSSWVPVTTTSQVATSTTPTTMYSTTSSLVLTYEGAFTCDGKTDGYYRDPYDCSKYYVCSVGITYPKNCAPGTHFNTITIACDWPSNVNCQPQTYSNGQVTSTTPTLSQSVSESVTTVPYTTTTVVTTQTVAVSGTTVQDTTAMSTQTVTVSETTVQDSTATATQTVTVSETVVSDTTAMSTQTATVSETTVQETTATATQTVTVSETKVLDTTAMSTQTVTVSESTVQETTATATQTVTVSETTVLDTTAMSTQTVTASETTVQETTATATQTVTVSETTVLDTTAMSTQTVTVSESTVQETTATATQTVTVSETTVLDTTAMSTQTVTVFGTTVQETTATATQTVTVSETTVLDTTAMSTQTVTASETTVQETTATATQTVTVSETTVLDTTAMSTQTVTASETTVQETTATATQTVTVSETTVLDTTAMSTQTVTVSETTVQETTATATQTVTVSETTVQDTTSTVTQSVTQSPQTVPDNEFCRSLPNGLYPYAKDCYKFFSCWGGASYVISCSLGTAFSEKGGFCDHIYNVDCGSRPAN